MRVAISFTDGDHEFIPDYKGFDGVFPRIGEKVAVVPAPGSSDAYFLHTVVDVRHYPNPEKGHEMHLLLSTRP